MCLSGNSCREWTWGFFLFVKPGWACLSHTTSSHQRLLSPFFFSHPHLRRGVKCVALLHPSLAFPLHLSPQLAGVVVVASVKVGWWWFSLCLGECQCARRSSRLSFSRCVSLSVRCSPFSLSVCVVIVLLKRRTFMIGKGQQECLDLETRRGLKRALFSALKFPSR